MNQTHLQLKYNFAKQIVFDEGYANEVLWQETVDFEELSESSLLRELAWVILSSGMKEQIIRRIFKNISPCFFNWCSSSLIAINASECYKNAIGIFRNQKKINAIINSSKQVYEIGFEELKECISDNPIETLLDFPFIGRVTVYHLAKNIGICIAKPDRHLVRIAELEGFDNVQEFCETISNLTGDCIPVVDIVFWRFANLNRDYLDILSSINYSNP
jgi:hypothetical protein